MIIQSVTNPKYTLFYVGGEALYELQSNAAHRAKPIDLWFSINRRLGYEISINTFTYAVDWLFLCGVVRMEENEIVLCS